MTSPTCFACGSRINLSPKGESGICENASCPGGIRFIVCGYCRQVSFSKVPGGMKCHNRDCRMYNLTRDRCPVCDKVSLIPFQGKPLCINRKCPGHKGVVAECFFCHTRQGEPSFINIPEVMFCTKGDCNYLLRRVEECDSCHQRSFVVDEKLCRNPECAISGKQVDRCPACGLKMLASDARGTPRCLKPGCAGPAPGQASPGTLPSQDTALTLNLFPPPKPEIEPLLPASLGETPSGRPLFPPAPAPPPAPLPIPAAAPVRLPPSPLPPPPAPAPGQPSAIEEAYDFLRRTLMQVNGKPSPLYLIIGLPGSGKTVYLAMLGTILGLRNQRFCFPFEGVETNWVKVDTLLTRAGGIAEPQRVKRIGARIRDLVFDFGLGLHEAYLARGQWPPPTAHLAEDDDAPATYFLVSEIARNLKPLAHVITLETSGEHYREVLMNFPKYAMGTRPANPTQRVLVDLMNQAEGFIVLVDPDNRDNDAIFKNFFLVLKDGLRPRALNRFYGELKAGLGAELPAGARPGGPPDFRRLLHLIREDDRRRKAFEEQLADEKRLTSARLTEVYRKLEEGKYEVALGEDGQWLNEMEGRLAELEPEMVKNAKNRLIPPGAKLTSDQVKQRTLEYCKGLIRACTDHLEGLARRKLERGRPPQEQSAILEIKKRFDLADSFRVDLDESSLREREVTRFADLKHVALVVTKSDKHPIIYPPDQYARRKLPSCDLHLRDIQDYLKLCGGQLRCYNASASGYTLLDGGAHRPGPAHTQTPINILQPLFDMLQISG